MRDKVNLSQANVAGRGGGEGGVTPRKNIVETLNNELVQPTLKGEKSECV